MVRPLAGTFLSPTEKARRWCGSAGLGWQEKSIVARPSFALVAAGDLGFLKTPLCPFHRAGAFFRAKCLGPVMVEQYHALRFALSHPGHSAGVFVLEPLTH
jgi:hypothetical protein